MLDALSMKRGKYIQMIIWVIAQAQWENMPGHIFSTNGQLWGKMEPTLSQCFEHNSKSLIFETVGKLQLISDQCFWHNFGQPPCVLFCQPNEMQLVPNYDILALFKTTVPCATLAASYFLLSDVETERRVDDESPSGFEAYWDSKSDIAY